MPDSAQLYDRQHDPQEHNNLYEQQPDRVKAMAARTIELFNRSNQLQQELDDGETQGVIDVHQEQQLTALGYIGASDPGEARELFNKLPLALKEQAKLPWEPPDTRELDAIDRDVHAVRLALAEHAIEPAEAQTRLQQCGTRYVKWLAEHGYPARVKWRIADLEELARSAGVTVDVQRWKGLLDAALGKSHKGK